MFLNIHNVTTLLLKIGRVLEVEDPFVEGRINRNYVGARALMDITKPFPIGCWIPRVDLPKLWIMRGSNVNVKVVPIERFPSCFFNTPRAEIVANSSCNPLVRRFGTTGNRNNNYVESPP